MEPEQLEGKGKCQVSAFPLAIHFSWAHDLLLLNEYNVRRGRHIFMAACYWMQGRTMLTKDTLSFMMVFDNWVKLYIMVEKTTETVDPN